MNSTAISCAKTVPVDRAASQQGADECATSEGYGYTRCVRHRQSPPKFCLTQASSVDCFSSFTLSPDSLPACPLRLRVTPLRIITCRNLPDAPSTVIPLASLQGWPQQLDTRPPSAAQTASGTLAEPTGPTEVHIPLGGCPSGSPLPARDAGQRKSLAAQAGGGFTLAFFPSSQSLPGWPHCLLF